MWHFHVTFVWIISYIISILVNKQGINLILQAWKRNFQVWFWCWIEDVIVKGMLFQNEIISFFTLLNFCYRSKNVSYRDFYISENRNLTFKKIYYFTCNKSGKSVFLFCLFESRELVWMRYWPTLVANMLMAGISCWSYKALCQRSCICIF